MSSFKLLSSDVVYFVPDELMTETDKAFLFSFTLQGLSEDVEQVWLPKSQIDYVGDEEDYPLGEWSAPAWLIKKKGLI